MKKNTKEFPDLVNRDLRHVKPGVIHKADAYLRSLINTAFTGQGVILFVAGIVFALGIVARH